MEAWSIKKKMGVGIYEKMRKGPFGNPFSYHVFFCQNHVLEMKLLKIKLKALFFMAKFFANHVFFFLPNTKFGMHFQNVVFGFLMGFQTGTKKNRKTSNQRRRREKKMLGEDANPF